MAVLTSARGSTMWVMSSILTVLYIFAGGTKLIGMPMHIEHFAQWGYPNWFRFVVGTWEVLFGLLLLVPRVAAYAAIALAISMVGAIYTEIFRGVPSQATAPGLLLVALLALIRWKWGTRRVRPVAVASRPAR